MQLLTRRYGIIGEMMVFIGPLIYKSLCVMLQHHGDFIQQLEQQDFFYKK